MEIHGLLVNFLICIHVHVLTRTLVLLGVTFLNKGFDLIACDSCWSIQ